MSEEFKNYLFTNLINQKGYVPARNKSGQLLNLYGISILDKDMQDSMFVLEIFNGDAFSADEIKQRMERNATVIDKLNKSFMNVFTQIFIFDGEIPYDKLETIKNSQRINSWDKKYYVSYTVRLDLRQVQRHFQLPPDVDGLDVFLSQMTDAYKSYTNQNDNTPRSNGFRAIPNRTPKVPIVTYILIVINILAWLGVLVYQKTSGLSSYDDALRYAGAKVNALIMNGEYWRLITPMFFHWTPMHLFVNSFSLFIVGPQVEMFFGKVKYIAIYLIAGIFGNLASFIFSQNPSAGASGAIFGLMGVLVYIWQKNRKSLDSSYILGVAGTIVFNIFYGLSNSGIDNFAHIGGLIGGYIAAVMVGFASGKQRIAVRTVAAVLAVILSVGGLYWGFNKSSNKADGILSEANQSFINTNYHKSEQLARDTLRLYGEYSRVKSNATAILAASLINQGKNEDAVPYAEQLVQLNPGKGHYYLGLCYYNLGDYANAKSELEQALKMDPSNKQVQEILNEMK